MTTPDNTSDESSDESSGADDEGDFEVNMFACIRFFSNILSSPRL